MRKQGGYGWGLVSSNRCSGPSFLRGHTSHDHTSIITLQFRGDHSTEEEARELREHFRCAMLC